MMGSGWIARGEEKFPELIETFNKLIEKDYGDEKPDMLQSLHYWCALAQLYQQEYEKAKINFDAVVEHFPESDYYEDSLFRRGVCAKGNEDYETARKNLSLELNVTQFCMVFAPSKITTSGSLGALDSLGNKDVPPISPRTLINRFSQTDTNDVESE